MIFSFDHMTGGNRELSLLFTTKFSSAHSLKINCIIIWQGSLEGNPSVLIGSFLVGILPYSLLKIKKGQSLSVISDMLGLVHGDFEVNNCSIV